MNQSSFLTIYLRDHHAAAGGGIALAKYIHSHNKRNIVGLEMRKIVDELIYERQILETLMKSFAIQPSRLKDSVVWMGEKLRFMKRNGGLLNYTPLSRILDIEAMRSAIHGRVGLWQTLQTIGRDDIRIDLEAAQNFESIARQQLNQMEQLHSYATVLFQKDERSLAPNNPPRHSTPTTA